MVLPGIKSGCFMETLIKPTNKDLFPNFGEVWKYRELFYIFAWRDIKVRYKQTILGIIWVVFQPFVSTVIFTVFFGNLAKIPSGNIPYSLFILIGLVFWGYFSGILSHSSNSLVENESIIKKIYFPRLVLPLSSAVTGLVDLVINLGLLLLWAAALGHYPSWQIFIIVPMGVVITALAGTGLGLVLASLNVRYRDVRYILPFFIQLLIFVSPIIYPSSIVRPSNRFILALNPITGVVEPLRTVFSGSNISDWSTLYISLLAAVAVFIYGLYYFKFSEKTFADEI